MNIFAEIDFLKQATGFVPQPAVRILSCDIVTAMVTNTNGALTVPEGFIFVATHIHADSFPLDGAGNPIFGQRQDNPFFGDVLRLAYARGGVQKREATKLMRAILGDTFLIFEEGLSTFQVLVDTDTVNAGMAVFSVWLTVTIHGYLLPQAASSMLMQYQMEIL